MIRKMTFILVAVAPGCASAACQSETTDGKDYYIVSVNGFNPPPFSPGDYPIGGIIYEATAKGLRFKNAVYPDRPTVTCSPAVHTYVTGVGALGADNVYATSIPNIGLRVLTPQGHPFPYVDSAYPWLNNAWNTYYAPKIQLIKTGNITAPGVLTGAYARYSADTAAGHTLVEYQFSSPLIVTPRVPTCKVDTPRIPVPMGRVVAATNFTGVGSTSPAENFQIRLSCSGGDPDTATRPYVTLTDATTPGNRSTTLSMTMDSTVKGIGIQILKDNVVLGYGPDSSAAGNTNQWSAGTVKQGQASMIIPLQARYVQTTARITSGSANANATFTMSYQ
ncbi:Fimbrial protein [compost metagenome]